MDEISENHAEQMSVWMEIIQETLTMDSVKILQKSRPVDEQQEHE